MFQDILIKNSLIEELIADADYANAAKRLLEDQKKTWKQLGEGYESLKNVRTKNFQFELKLAKDLSRHYVIVYNGPKCGASAPDHFHFQAGTKNFMPIVDDFHQLKNEYGELLFENDEITVSAIDDGLRRVIAFESMNNEMLTTAFSNFYEIYSLFSVNNEEP